MTEGIEIIIGKDGVCRARKEPWGVIECETEQDFHFLECAVGLSYMDFSMFR